MWMSVKKTVPLTNRTIFVKNEPLYHSVAVELQGCMVILLYRNIKKFNATMNVI